MRQMIPPIPVDEQIGEPVLCISVPLLHKMDETMDKTPSIHLILWNSYDVSTHNPNSAT